MIVKSISLINYRNYDKCTAEFCPETNIIYGKNAQGKTNLLEGVYIFSSGKSYRALTDSELIMRGREFFRAKIKFENFDRECECEIIVTNGKRKTILVNGVPLTKTSELLGLLKVTLFGPGELSLISGAPDGRRNLMDMHISSVRPLYYKYLKEYLRTVRQKNNLLKKIMMGEENDEMLSVWNEKMADTGAKIMMYRNNFVKNLSPESSKIHSEISGGKENLEIRYTQNSFFEDMEDEEQLKEALLKNIEKKRDAEIHRGQALIGPHRDDLEFLINGSLLKSYGSQGQQRTAVIAVKCAQTELVYRDCGEYPVLLLDDIMSELDTERRRFLSKKIRDMQVIITCTEADIIKNADSVKYFYIDNGKIKERQGR